MCWFWTDAENYSNDAEKDTAGCRALNRKYIVIGENVVFLGPPGVGGLV